MSTSALLTLTLALGLEANAQSRSESIKLVPAARIDANTENLARLGPIALSKSGMVAISQFEDGRVLVYDSTGKKVGTVGRKGAGTGEFRDIGNGGMWWLADT